MPAITLTTIFTYYLTCAHLLRAGNDTVPISMRCGGDTSSIDLAGPAVSLLLCRGRTHNDDTIDLPPNLAACYSQPTSGSPRSFLSRHRFSNSVSVIAPRARARSRGLICGVLPDPIPLARAARAGNLSLFMRRPSRSSTV